MPHTSLGQIVRLTCAGAAVMALAACATAPNAGGAPYSMHDLRVCPGMAVANAPPTGPGGMIINYAPVAVIRGTILARAPVDACLSSAFGPRSGGAGAMHLGLDLYTGAPRPVLAAGDGRVEWVREQKGYGLVIEIRHADGVATRYAHLSSVAPQIRAGARVAAGEAIARTGKSGNATAIHLHYEILIDGRQRDPLTIGG